MALTTRARRVLASNCQRLGRVYSLRPPSVTKPAGLSHLPNCAHKEQVMIWDIVLTAAFLGPAPLRPPPPRTQRSPQCAAPDLVSALTIAEDMSLPDVPDFDLLDAFLVAPLLIPILGAVALQTGGAAARNKMAQLETERSLDSANAKIEKLKADVAERDEKLEKKAAFWTTASFSLLSTP